MKLVVEISCNGAAFSDDDNTSYEVASILRDAAAKFEQGYVEVYLRDTNGNPVGVAKFVKWQSCRCCQICQ